MTQECDCCFCIPTGTSSWGKIQYEPVLIFVCLPFVVHRPSFSAKQILLEDFPGAMLQEDDLWKTSHERGGGFFVQIFTASAVLLLLATIVGAEVVVSHRRFLTFPNKRQSMTMALISGTNCVFWKDGTPFRSAICVIFEIFGEEDLFGQASKTSS